MIKKMICVIDELFEDREIDADGHCYINCHFKRCRVINRQNSFFFQCFFDGGPATDCYSVARTKIIRRLLCALGFHKWIAWCDMQTIPQPPLVIECEHCGKVK